MTVNVTKIGAAIDNSTSAGSLTITTTSAISSGDTIVLLIGQRGNSIADPTSITDSNSNTYTKAASQQSGSGTGAASLWYAQNSSAMVIGGTITITWGAPVPQGTAAIALTLNGVAAASFDAVGNVGGNSASPSASVATANANDVLIGLCRPTANPTVTEDGTFIHIDELIPTGVAQFHLNAASKLVSSTGTYPYAPALSTATNWSDIVAAFKVAGTTPVIPQSAALLGCG